MGIFRLGTWQELLMHSHPDGAPDRICSVKGSMFYHPQFSKLICVYLNDIAVDLAVEACRSEGWVIKYELDDDGLVVEDLYNKPCMSIFKGKVEFYIRKSDNEQCKVFLSDYTR